MDTGILITTNIRAIAIVPKEPIVAAAASAEQHDATLSKLQTHFTRPYTISGSISSLFGKTRILVEL
ncbi:MAG: hypothetical protein Q9227_004669 [Pyrenula ochraceoflavens]